MAVLQAAVLHDTIEDTGTTAVELEQVFGADVSRLVVEVTDDKGLAKAERKRLQVQHAPHLSHRAKLIKISDKICNVRDVVQSPPEDWNVERRLEYLSWSRQVVDGCRGVSPALEDCFDRLVSEGEAAIHPVG